MLTITMYRLPNTADQATQKRTCNPVYVDWLCLTSHRQRGHLETAPLLLSLAKDVKLGFYTVPTGTQKSLHSTPLHIRCDTPYIYMSISNTVTLLVTLL